MRSKLPLYTGCGQLQAAVGFGRVICCKMTRSAALVAIVLAQATAFVAPPAAAPALTPRQGLLEPYGSQKSASKHDRTARLLALARRRFRPIGRYPRRRIACAKGWLAAGTGIRVDGVNVALPKRPGRSTLTPSTLQLDAIEVTRDHFPPAAQKTHNQQTQAASTPSRRSARRWK